MRNRRALALTGLLVAFLIVRVVAVVLALSGAIPHFDIQRFLQIAHANGRPYAAYAVEYPPVFVVVLKLLGAAFPDDGVFTVAVVAISMAAELLMAVLLWRAWSARAALLFLFIDSFLIGLFLVRLDLVVTALALAAVVACMRSRALRAGLLMVLAIGMKLWPLPLALIGAVIAPRRARREYVVTVVAAGAALVAVWIAIGGGVQAVQQVVTFRGATGWQVESAVGSFVHLFTREAPYAQSGAQRFGHVPAGVAPLLTVVAAVVTLLVLLWVNRRTLGSAWVASVGAFLACSTLLSPQFLAWLIPAGAIAWAAGDVAVGAGVLAVTVLTLLEDWQYPGILELQPAGLALVVVRNAALIVVVGVAMHAVWRRRELGQRTAAALVAPTGA